MKKSPIATLSMVLAFDFIRSEMKILNQVREQKGATVTTDRKFVSVVSKRNVRTTYDLEKLTVVGNKGLGEAEVSVIENAYAIIDLIRERIGESHNFRHKIILWGVVVF